MLPVSTRIARVEEWIHTRVPESWLSIASNGSEDAADAEGDRMNAKKRQMHRGLRIKAG